ncbi:MAG: ATP synthase F1 subunit epsilon [Ignavibacteria bacterium]|nr:ATP synthase F1 subunit epsilon [Ignavibacteria bacterium]
MADKVFKLEIVTPRRVLFSGDVVSFSAPGVVGGFQVLYNHAPMLAAIGIGEVKLREPHGDEVRYATSGGFVDVKNNHVVMLAETAERSEEIDKMRAESARDRALKQIAEKESEHDVERARVELERAVNRIHIAEKR